MGTNLGLQGLAPRACPVSALPSNRPATSGCCINSWRCSGATPPQQSLHTRLLATGGSAQVLAEDSGLPVHARRTTALLAALAVALGTSFSSSRRAKALAQAPAGPSNVVVPLKWFPGGFFIRYSIRRTSKPSKGTVTAFLGVADTGSPYLLVAKCLRTDCPNYCGKWGCFDGEQGRRTNEASTFEGYASGLIEMEWREGGVLQFLDAVGPSPAIPELKFGVQGRNIGFGGLGEGVDFGLIRDHMVDVRTSFLEQTPYTSMVFDLRAPGSETLTFAEKSAIRPGEDYVPLVDTRIWGAGCRYYAAVAKEIRVGGQVLPQGPAWGEGTRSVLCVFDTGTTGASMTESMYEAYTDMAKYVMRRGGSMAQARKIEVTLGLASGKDLTLGMYMGEHPSYGFGLDLVTPIQELAWAGVGPAESIKNYRVPEGVSVQPRPFEDVLMLGLGFFIGSSVAIDTIDGRLSIR
eukprot:TRINITY_DN74609_c0_g1_i1.p1 TRINITY_DN74609_c0_g1~~TRINITY_DN74609_c0_g1_i1.p1  ORF type:complete len:463 (+),score=33.13 TRINITY_DN74609_c0_g1_i1:95-1483(+)